MKPSSTITVDNATDLEELLNRFPSLASDKRLRIKNDIISYHYDNPEQAAEAFSLSRQNVKRQDFVPPKTHVSAVIEKPYSSNRVK